jgi:hypothetical protein
MVFHLHRLTPVRRELCRPHCLAFPLYPPKNGHSQAAPARPKSADTVAKSRKSNDTENFAKVDF